jgi:hypothetical protein
MTTVQLTGDRGAVIFGAESLLVQVKRRWADDWQTMPYLTPLSAQLSISPDMPRADFVYHYGQIKREDNAEFIDFDPLNLSNWYVRVLIDDQQVFVGILMDDRFDLLGALNNQPSGDQAMTAYGLEHLLDRASVLGAVTLGGVISHTPTFNLVENYGGAVRGNRSDSLVDGVYVFANNDARWSNLDIIHYVLAHHTDFGFEIDLSGQFDVLADIYGAYWFEGLTVRQVLDKLIDRRRGLGWYVWSDGSTVSIHVFTVFERDIGLGDVQISGNPQQVEIDADTLDVQEVTISQSESQLYDRIVVQGARARSVFTVSVQEGSLKAAWSASDEAAYKAVAGATNEERDAERESDRFAPVYQHFTLDENWNETANDGQGGDRLPVLPAFNDLAQLQSGSSPAMQIRRPFNRTLPFYDENGDPVAPVVIGLASPESGDRYVQLDGAGKVLGQAKSLVRMMDEKPGIVLRAGINHALGLNHFDPTANGSDTKPVVDYETLLATVSIETDTRPSVDVMLNADTDNARVLVLTVHDAEFWYVTPDTVRGVENGQLQRETGGAVRDDTDKLRYLAALATGWYGQKRSSITLTTRNLPSNLSLGSLVTSAASSWHKENIGTVLSSIDYDFVGRTTTIRTGYAELDLQAMLDIPGMSDFRSVGRAFNRQQAQLRQITDRLANMPVRYAMSGSSGEGTDEIAAVDFIVDNFDRGDANGLGSYWQNSLNRVQIVDGALRQVSGSTNTFGLSFSLNRNISQQNASDGLVYVNGVQQGGSRITYASALSRAPDSFEENLYNYQLLRPGEGLASSVVSYTRELTDSDYIIELEIESATKEGQAGSSTQNYELFAGICGLAFSGVKDDSGAISFDRCGFDYWGQANSLTYEAPAISYVTQALNSEYAIEWADSGVGDISEQLVGSASRTLNVAERTGQMSGASANFNAFSMYTLSFDGALISKKTIEPEAVYLSQSESDEVDIRFDTYSWSVDIPDKPGTSNYFVRGYMGAPEPDGYSSNTPSIFTINTSNSEVSYTARYISNAEVTYDWSTLSVSGGNVEAVNPATNKLRLNVSGNSVSAYLNGAYLGMSQLSAPVAGKHVGIISRLIQSNLAFYSGLKIKRFKAWRSDIPEPSDNQSGHGTYDADGGGFNYTDGYHVPDGNGGIVYDPTALD